jgi:ribose transport system ATP-binding protein
MAPEPCIELAGLTKRFSGVLALDGVDLEVAAGEVHGLLGENGSGKSTLIKVLAGFHGVDGGRLSVAGTPVPLPLTADMPKRLGLQFVHQDLGLIESLSVVENLRVGEMAGRRLRISWRDERRRAADVFDRYGISLDPRATVGDIRPVQRAQLAIARAMEGMRASSEREGDGGGLLVLDEPTVFLPREEVDQLFALMREVAASGASVLFVSHDIDEVLRVTDRMTVLRDGRRIDTLTTAGTAHGDVVERIIGRRLARLAPPAHAGTAPSRDADVLARVTGLRADPLTDLSFEIRAGEVLGVTGLLGSGFEQLPYALCGAEPPRAGTLELDGRTLNLAKLASWRATPAGIALIPADRKNDGAVESLSVTDNVTMPTLGRHGRPAFLRRREMTRSTLELMERFDVRPRDPSLPLASLSGGNQQKALIAKWLQTEPRLLLLHEPTQGVDIGAREQIFDVIRASAAAGRSVLCASADHEQLAAVCDRVLVFSGGTVVAELTGLNVTKDRITERCLSGMPLAEVPAEPASAPAP